MEGSPPLTRGILATGIDNMLAFRFTPAHAGNTPYGFRLRSWNKVHPRSRGEYIRPVLPTVKVGGSPPLTRGILRFLILLSVLLRFTPAHAGNTSHGYV